MGPMVGVVARPNIGRPTHFRADNRRVSEALLDAGTTALADGRWAEARSAFEAVLATADLPRAHDGLAEALWWLGEPQASLVHRERAFVGFRRAGQDSAAAAAAIEACVVHLINFGNGAAAAGWLARAESLAGAELQGWICLMRAFMVPDADEACALMRRCIDAGRETGDVDLELSARSDLGGRLVAAGRVAEGLALIDEALAGALAGECRRRATVVWACCTMLGACETAGDLERATQWLRVVDDFTARYGCPFMYATCRAHYGGLLVATGRWEQAERELAAAIRMSGRAGPVPHAMAITVLARPAAAPGPDRGGGGPAGRLRGRPHPGPGVSGSRGDGGRGRPAGALPRRRRWPRTHGHRARAARPSPDRAGPARRGLRVGGPPRGARRRRAMGTGGRARGGGGGPCRRRPRRPRHGRRPLPRRRAGPRPARAGI